MNKLKCKSCSHSISGKISIDTYRRKLGQKWIHEVDFYCKPCFRKLNIERSWNVYRKEASANKRKYNR